MKLVVLSLLWSLGIGNSLLVTGNAGGSRNRADAAIDVLPSGRFGRFGVNVALRGATYRPFADDGLVTAGVDYLAAAARPRLALVLHGDAGLALGPRAPAFGGGIETYLWLWPKRLGPLAVVFDVTSHLVLDGVDGTRLVIAAATRLSGAF